MSRYAIIAIDPSAPTVEIALTVYAKNRDQLASKVASGDFSIDVQRMDLPAATADLVHALRAGRPAPARLEIKSYTKLVQPKQTSRGNRMAEAVAVAKDLLNQLQSALTIVNDVRGEYEEQYDAMPEGWQQSERGQQCETIKDIDCDPDSVLSECEQALDEIEGAL